MNIYYIKDMGSKDSLILSSKANTKLGEYKAQIAKKTQII